MSTSVISALPRTARGMFQNVYAHIAYSIPFCLRRELVFSVASAGSVMRSAERRAKPSSETPDLHAHDE